MRREQLWQLGKGVILQPPRGIAQEEPALVTLRQRMRCDTLVGKRVVVVVDIYIDPVLRMGLITHTLDPLISFAILLKRHVTRLLQLRLYDDTQHHAVTQVVDGDTRAGSCRDPWVEREEVAKASEVLILVE